MYDFIKFDESGTIEEAIAAYENATKTKLYAGDERRIMINTFAYIAKVIAGKANFLSNQYFAGTAVFPYLQYIGEGRDVFPLPAEKALAPMQFNVSYAQPFDIEIPQGTRVTPDGTHFFATKEKYTLTQGSLNVQIPVEATVAGDSYNGFAPGTINTLVDSIPNITSVTNIETSSGGSDVEDIEAYRERIQLKPHNYNTAGAEDAYIYLAKSADSSVGCVSAINDSDSSILITILCKDGTIPNDLVIERVSNAVADKQKKRPLSDKVTVQKATAAYYGIDFDYTIRPEDTNIANSIISKVNKAVTDYIAYLKSKLGIWINPDELRNYILNAGAYTVTIHSPTIIVVNKQSVALISGDPVVNYIGIYGEGL